VIDIPSLARRMIHQAQHHLLDRPGVFEVHFCDDDITEIGPTQLWRFIQDWELKDEITLTREMHCQQFVGLVGDGCAVLYRIDNISADKVKEHSS